MPRKLTTHPPNVDVLPLPVSSPHNTSDTTQDSSLLSSMSGFLVRAANDFLESVLKRPLIPWSENRQLKKSLQEKDQEISRLSAEVQTAKDDLQNKTSRISILERDIASVKGDVQLKDAELAQLRSDVRDTKDNILLREERLSSLQTEVTGFRHGVQNRDSQLFTFRTEIDNFRVTLNVKDEEITSLQHEIQDTKDALQARDERIVSLAQDLEEERKRVHSKDEETSKAEEVLRRAEGDLAGEVARLTQELEESVRRGEEMAESQQQLSKRLEEQEIEMDNTLAEWETRHDVLERAKEAHMEAQRALEEQLENNNAELDRMQAAVGEREQALSVALEDTERKDREISLLRSSLSIAHNEIDVRDGSLASLQQDLDRVISNLEGLRGQNSALEEKIKVQTAEAENMQSEFHKLTVTLTRAEKKAADDLADVRRELRRQSSQMSVVRQNLDRARAEGKAKDDVMKDLKIQLKDAGDEQRRREKELQTSLSRQAELEKSLNKHAEESRTLEKELADAKGRLIQVTILSEERGLELAATRKESDGMRDDVTKLRQELGSLKADHGAIEQSLQNAEKNATRLTDEVLQLRGQLSDSHERCAELEDIVRHDEVGAQLMEQKLEALQQQYEEAQGMVFTRGHELEETQNALGSTIAERDELQESLIDARNLVSRKDETEQTLTSSIEHLQNIVDELGEDKKTLEEESNQMREILEKQKEEIGALQNDLNNVKASNEAAISEWRLETERAKDRNVKLVEEVDNLHAANSTLQEQLSQTRVGAQAREAEHLDVHQSKDEEISKLKEELAKKLAESQAAYDALSKAEELQRDTQEKLSNAASESDETKRILSEKIESRQATIQEKDEALAKLNEELKALKDSATQVTQSPKPYMQSFFEEPDKDPSADGRPESIRSTGPSRMTGLLGSMGIFGSRVTPKRKTFYSIAQEAMAKNGSTASGVGKIP